MKYIAFYDDEAHLYEKRSVAPSAANVVRYMAEVMSDCTAVEIISPSRTLLPKGFFKSRKTQITDKITLLQPFTFGVRTAIGRLLSAIQIRLWLFFYLLKNCKRGEKIIAYHSLSTMSVIKAVKKIKKLNVVLEIREIYADVKNKDNAKEYDFFKLADSFIFPTTLMNEKINKINKPTVIATGIYKPEPRLSKKIDDGRLHIVYAGNLNPAKGGAFAAIEAGKYLNDKYHLHILGYGSEADINNITNNISNQANACTISYDGCLHGEDFNRFLQSCHLGLSTQNPTGAYNDTSFPSKILTYMANGLDVLSIRIPAVEKSPVGDYVFYYDNQAPEEIAKIILSYNPTNSSDKYDLLEKLDHKLREEIFDLLNS